MEKVIMTTTLYDSSIEHHYLANGNGWSLVYGAFNKPLTNNQSDGILTAEP